WTFYGGKFKARQGHIISAIATQRRFLVAYNHTTGQFVTFDGNVQRENQVPILKAWLASIAWGTAGCAAALVLGLMNKTEALWKGGDYTTPVFVGAVWLFFFSTLFVGPPLLITAWIFSKLRNQRFQRLWAPAFHAFLQERTPELVQRFRPLPER